MSAASKKPHPPGPSGQRLSTDTLATKTSPSRSSSSSPVPPATSTANGLSRSPSIRGQPVSARAAARKPGGSRSNLSQTNIPTVSDFDKSAEEDARLENAQLIDDLKRQLQKAETTSEQHQKQIANLQLRLDETLDDHGKLEEQGHEKDDKIQALRSEVREATRQRRELEASLETERNTMIREKEQQASREEELQSTIQRLNETMRQKEMRMQVEGERPNLSRSSSFRNRASPDLENGQFAPSAQLERSPSRNNSKLILQKDKLIESLRLELAEAQIKLAEMEHRGDGRFQDLEKQLLEARMANARLLEDNESYQLLLSEKTLKGDFTKVDFMQESGNDDGHQGLGSLADELESAGEGENDNYKRLEGEIKSLRDQNKALTLYIEKIIGRVLQHEGFEHVLDKGDTDIEGPPKRANTDKELPPPPPKDDAPAPTFLQRARSVVAGQVTRPRPQPKGRPVSQMPVADAVNTPHENPETAPSIPLGRSQSTRGGPGHRRARSDQADGAAAAAVVGQMYRGPAFGRSTSGGPMSPGISPVMSPSGGTPRQNPFFTGASTTATTNSGSRNLTATAPGDRGSSSNSIVSDHSGDLDSNEHPSPPRGGNAATNVTAGVTTQNKLRPLRLVQENQEMESGDQGGASRAPDDEAARKKANRGSWMGWFNRGLQDEVQRAL